MQRLYLSAILILCVQVHSVMASGAVIKQDQLETDKVPSPVSFAVLTPPGYEDSDGRYPLLLWLHGGGGSSDFLVDQQPLFERVWRAGHVPGMVVATPSAGRSLYVDFRDGSQRWESFLLEEFLPHLQASYRIDPERIWVGGVSMGGMGALRLAFKHPDRFRAVVALEPGIEPALRFSEIELEDRFWRGDAFFAERFGDPVDEDYWAANNPATIAARDPERLRSSGLAIFLEVGTEDAFGLYRGTEFLHRILFDHRVPHEYRYLMGADHVGRTLGWRIQDALLFLGRIDAPDAEDPEVERVRRMVRALQRRAGLDADPE